MAAATAARRGAAASAALTLALALAAITGADAWHEATLPVRARGGLAWQLVQAKYASAGRAPVAQAAQQFTQAVDHGDAGAGTFQQRYYVNSDSWDQAKGPVFVYIGGEAPLSGTPTGWVLDLGQAHSALLLALEHRFYGESVPNNDLTTPNLQYLTVEQALEDLVTFVRAMRTSMGVPAGAKVVVFGGSYPGALAGWVRTKYGSDIDAALASSGVVNAVQDYTAFDQLVRAAVNSTCASLLERTAQAFDAAFAAGGSAKTNALALFPAPTALTRADFAYMVADSFSMAVQYGHKDQLCGALRDGTEQELMAQFADFTNSFWGTAFASDCFYNTDCLQNGPAASWQPTARAWRWQKCSELAYLQSAPAVNPLRSTSLTIGALMAQCQTIFGQQPDTSGFNAQYGGAQPAGTNVFYSNFRDDPWQGASVQARLGPTRPEFTAECDLCGHCQDLHPPSMSDPEPLRYIRQLEAAYLQDWLRA